MTAEELLHAWRSEGGQSRPAFDTDRLLDLVRRDQRRFDRMIFWRDVREAGGALALIPFWIVMGLKLELPWGWYLSILALLWYSGFLLRHRIRTRNLASRPEDSLRRQLADSLAQVEAQIWLLHNVHQWALIPMGLAISPFVGQVAWRERADGWFTVVVMGIAVALIVAGFGLVVWVNRYAVRTELEPRRQELVSLLAALADEASESIPPEPRPDPS